MKLAQIYDEYERNGRIAGRTLEALRALLRESRDPYSAITTAGDVRAIPLAADLARLLRSDDNMVRWNAAGVLFTRFRDASFARCCLELLQAEDDLMVRGILVTGAGELLPLLQDSDVRHGLAETLLAVFETDEDLRKQAYEAIARASESPSLEERDVIAAFRVRYGV